MGRGPDWTPAQDAILREMAKTVGSWHDIVPAVDRSWSSVRGRADKLGIRLNPEAVNARRSQTGAKRWTPERRVAMSALAKASNAIRFARAKPCSEADRLAAVRAYYDRWRRWCPEYLWPVYSDLKDRKLMRAAEARQIVLDDFAADLRRTLRQIAAVAAEQHKRQREEAARSRTDFDAILARVAAGKSKVQVLHRPVSRDHEFSLVGSTLA